MLGKSPRAIELLNIICERKMRQITIDGEQGIRHYRANCCLLYATRSAIGSGPFAARVSMSL